MEVAIGSDHAGLQIKKQLTACLTMEGYTVLDCGTNSEESVDYPDIAEKVAAEVLNKGIPGVLVCGTGIGISIAANKIRGIRAALCHESFAARMAREHNDANIAVLGARITGIGLAEEIIKTFLKTGFLAGRHQLRVEKITALENKMEGRARSLDYIEKYVRPVDPEIADVIAEEEKRQRRKLELIASENLVSRAVMAAQGSVLTNKYAEGYPGKRYYGGCEFVDVAETLAIERAKALFGAEHANVQPHSGAQANTAVYFAVLQPGDVVLGMNLSHGGHLTHGSKVNLSGKYFNFFEYGVDPQTEKIDYDQLRKVALQTKPKLIVAGASAYPRTIDFKRFREIADEIGALLMVDMAHIAGLVVGGMHPSPIPYAHFVTTTTHKTLRGPRGGLIMCRQEWATKIDKAVFPGIQGGPLMHVIAAKAVCFHEASQPEFKLCQQQIVEHARVLAAGRVENGLRLVSGGTDNHLMLVDVSSKGLNVKEAEAILESINITVNKNGIPFDPEKPTITSGIRIGTPAVTTRGLCSKDMVEIARAIALAMDNPQSEEQQAQARAVVDRLCVKYPLY